MMTAFSEGLSLADKAGLKQEDLLDVLVHPMTRLREKAVSLLLHSLETNILRQEMCRAGYVSITVKRVL